MTYEGRVRLTGSVVAPAKPAETRDDGSASLTRVSAGFISESDRVALLAFADSVVPRGSESIWLTGSRARGVARPNSDWDVLVVHPDAPDGETERFDRGTAKGIAPDGNEIELILGLGTVVGLFDPVT
jgi:nucleotidyltransferase-like protein